MDAASFIKSVHAGLRQKWHEGHEDFDNIWQEHCNQSDTLQKYAAAMHHLAVDNWQRLGEPQEENRIFWCKNVIMEYYFNGILQKILTKQARRLFYLENGQNIQSSMMNAFVSKEVANQVAIIQRSFINCDKVKLLDVGSCYNPFAEFSQSFVTTAIDLCPADKSVIQCDFLNVAINEAELSEQTNDGVTCAEWLKSNQLQARYFHVVIFCLLLSYFPSPVQRWKCCIHAHRLLMQNGLLLIITPDSSHQNRNSKMVKSWKSAIESIGFTRWKYVKLDHLHCMAFRKSCDVTKNDKDKFASSMYIPQDFNDLTVHNNTICNDANAVSCSDDTKVSSYPIGNNAFMNELPFCDLSD
ncbi:putative methyltransferase BTM2-like protein [Trichoplax sp. H2]|nr:putative methyltransferase BTM2-like protein [Trichoplax sp. H2]|eukprot:RDD43815.1 putative methyltransferase BTM2-like protein [Trichoplax sp. H2]